MYRSDNPIVDYDRHCASKNAWLNKRPVCARCNQHVQDDHAYEIAGEIYCEGCVEQCMFWIDD